MWLFIGMGGFKRLMFPAVLAGGGLEGFKHFHVESKTYVNGNRFLQSTRVYPVWFHQVSSRGVVFPLISCVPLLPGDSGLEGGRGQYASLLVLD